MFTTLVEDFSPVLARSMNENCLGTIHESEIGGDIEFLDWFLYLSRPLVGRWGLERLKAAPLARVDVLASGGCCLWLGGSPIDDERPLEHRTRAAEALDIKLRPLMARNPATGEPIVIPWR